MSDIRPIVERDEMMFRFSLERAFVERWLSSGDNGIPQMPHMPTIGKATRFHLPSVEAWLLKHFQKGGEPASLKSRKEMPA